MSPPEDFAGFPPVRAREGTCAKLGSTPEHDWHHPTTAGGRVARRICRTECPVREKCLDHALANDERLSVWGGMTPIERWDELVRRGETPPTKRHQYGKVR